MATTSCGVFEEHLGVIAALKENFLRREDAISVAQTNSLREEMAQLCRARESEVKEAIRGTEHMRIECHEIHFVAEERNKKGA